MPSKELIDGEWMKICSCKECDLAGQYQPVSNFYNQANSKDGLNSGCKKCRKSQVRHYAECNRTKIAERQKKRQQANKEIIAERKKAHYQKNRDKILKQKKDYYYKNKEKIIQNVIEYEKIRRANDPYYRLRKNISSHIRNAIKQVGAKKDYKTFQALPYTPQELREHIENQFDKKMNWDNYGDYWHIDHIIPQAALPYKSLEDENFQKCWALENLRPLEATENSKKGSLYEGERHTYANNKE